MSDYKFYNPTLNAPKKEPEDILADMEKDILDAIEADFRDAESHQLECDSMSEDETEGTLDIFEDLTEDFLDDSEAVSLEEAFEGDEDAEASEHEIKFTEALRLIIQGARMIDWEIMVPSKRVSGEGDEATLTVPFLLMGPRELAEGEEDDVGKLLSIYQDIQKARGQEDTNLYVVAPKTGKVSEAL